MSYKQPGEWRLFQIAGFRKFFRRLMRPRTHSQVYRSKTIAAAGYLICSIYLFNRFAYKAIKGTEGTVIEKAVNLNISDAKIVKFENFRVKEVLDYRREDYPELIENRPKYARE